MTRNARIVDAYRETPNLRIVGEQFIISHERVRQIVVRHEKLTGEMLPRGVATPHYGWRTARILWKCAGCGEKRILLPCVAVLHNKCHRCASRSRVTDTLVEDTIVKIMEGGKWHPVALAAGYPVNGTSALQRSVYTALQHQNRYDSIAQLWPRGIPHWLKRYTIRSKTMCKTIIRNKTA